MKRIAITGAAGFIGKNLVEALQDDNELILIDDLSTGDKDFLEQYPHVITDLRDPLYLEVDVIYHLAAITDTQYERPRDQYKANAQAMKTIADMASRYGAKLIYASSAAIYGNEPTPNKESSECIWNVESGYALSKVDCEILAQTLSLPNVGLRFFNVFGKHEDKKGSCASMVSQIAQQVFHDIAPELYKWGEQRRDFVYVKDVVRALKLAEGAPDGVYNVGTGHSTSFNEVVKWVNEAYGKSLAPRYIDNPWTHYQEKTEASLTHARKWLKYLPEWTTEAGIKDYIGECLYEYRS